MTRQRLALGLAALVGLGTFLLWWTCTPDRDAIQALLKDVHQAVEAGDFESALPAFRRDFAFGGGAGQSSVVAYDNLVEVVNRELGRGTVEELEVRNVEIDVDGDHAEVTAMIRLHGDDDIYSMRPLPVRFQLIRGEDTELYRGWRLYRGEFRRLDDN